MPHTPEQIVKIIDQMEDDHQDLHKIMDLDFDLYEQQPYPGEENEKGEDRLAGYAHFTSNNPTTQMDLFMHYGRTARRVIQVNEPRATDARREINNMRELCALGMMESAEEWRRDHLMPPLQPAAFAMSGFRGRVARCALLVKEEIPENIEANQQKLNEYIRFLEMGINMGYPEFLPETETYVRVTDWDPRNTYWGMGKRGLAWACQKSWKTRMDIIEEYGEQSDPDPSKEYDEDDDTQYAVYDWFDDRENTVLVNPKDGETIEAKVRTPHGMKRNKKPVVPVAIALAEDRPYFQANEEDSFGKRKQHNVFYGKGLYHGNRGIFNEDNFMGSVAKELSHRAIKPSYEIKSRSGDWSLPEDPSTPGQEIQESTTEEQQVVPIPIPELTQTALVWMQSIAQMRERGGFSTINYGSTPHALSSLAINDLRQGTMMHISLHAEAVALTDTQTLNILCDSYASGEFGTMTFSGRMQDSDRTSFSQEIPPEAVDNGGMIEVKIIPQLPHDDQMRLAMIRQLRDGFPASIMGDRDILDIADFQDPDSLLRGRDLQLARMGTPLAQAYQAFLGAWEQISPEIQEMAQTPAGMMALSQTPAGMQALIHADEFTRQQMAAWLQTMQLMMMGGQAPPTGAISQQGGPPLPRSPLPSPEVAPPEMFGRGATPNPQAASAGAANNPTRPGAQNRILNSSEDVMGF